MGCLEKLLTFRKGGVHPSPNKELTEALPIETMPVSRELAVVMSQHIGAPAEALVKKGDVIEEGQLIADVKKGLGTTIAAPWKGKVKALGKASHPVRIEMPAILIETSQDEAAHYEVHPWHELSPDELLDLVHQAGVVGAGGAGFPTHVKLRPPKDASISELIINGAECEPYLTADHRLMLEDAAKIIEGIKIMMAILGVKKCFVGIEDNKPDAIIAMTKAADKSDIVIAPLKTKYPQGSEKQLVYAITGRRIGSGALPASVGVVVQNVATAYAVYEAVVMHKPMIERIVTVSGKGIKRPANLRVRIGTRVSDIVEYLGGLQNDVKKVILGGPMMGFATSDLSTPVTKTTSGILFLTADEVDLREGGTCVRCGWCLDACPMGLEPKEIALYVEAGKGKETAKFGTLDCFECGSCAFVCPAKRPLVQLIRIAKQNLRHQ